MRLSASFSDLYCILNNLVFDTNKILFHERKIQNINAHVAYVKLKIIIARHDEIIIYY